jgi:hypothetical protein
MEETMQQEETLATETEEVIEEAVEVEIPSEEKDDNTENEVIVEADDKSSTSEEDKTETEEYSDSVQKRINKLTYKLRESERQNAEALAWAKKVQEENSSLKVKADSANTAMFTEYDNRVNTELESAKAEYKVAFESGDTDKIVAANEKLSRLSVEAESLRRVSEQKKTKDKDNENESNQVVSPQPQPEQQVVPDEKAQAWAKKNEWFGQDQALTFASFGIHRELMEEGYDGTTDEYYTELDKRLSKFGSNNYNANEQVSDSPVQRVASPSRQARNNKARSKSIKLTQSQVAIAKKLGVPLEEYAKYVKQ